MYINFHKSKRDRNGLEYALKRYPDKFCCVFDLNKYRQAYL